MIPWMSIVQPFTRATFSWESRLKILGSLSADTPVSATVGVYMAVVDVMLVTRCTQRPNGIPASCPHNKYNPSQLREHGNYADERAMRAAVQSSSQDTTNVTISLWIIWICDGSSCRSLRPFSSQ